MSRKMKVSSSVIIAIVAIIATLGLLALVFAGKMQAPLSPSTTPNPTASTQAQNSNNANPATPGSYVDYSDSIIASTSGIKLLFFHAPWCPQCRALDASIKSSPIPNGITIIKTDYDSNQKLRQKYGVTIQTTVVRVDDNGNLVKKYVAYDKPTLENVIKNTQ